MRPFRVLVVVPWDLVRQKQQPPPPAPDTSLANVKLPVFHREVLRLVSGPRQPRTV